MAAGRDARDDDGGDPSRHVCREARAPVGGGGDGVSRDNEAAGGGGQTETARGVGGVGVTSQRATETDSRAAARDTGAAAAAVGETHRDTAIQRYSDAQTRRERHRETRHGERYVH